MVRHQKILERLLFFNHLPVNISATEFIGNSSRRVNVMKDLNNPFFSHQGGVEAPVAPGDVGQFWLISADKVFSSDIDGYKDFARFLDLDFFVKKVSLFDGAKSSDSIVSAEPVEIRMPVSKSCAMIQGYLANGKEIAKITLKKIVPLGGSLKVAEEKEFSKCLLQSFRRRGEIALFSFRYSAYSDAYTDLEGDQAGTAATKVDLATWEVESK
ncbi:MAG: hypothetical protein LBJ16_04090 [Holosporaceae bacterium]|jgi:hypothetical protein|nr:hypothetical protein [Holosporaceae bacterium]